MISKIVYRSFKNQIKNYILYFLTLWISIIAVYTFLAFAKMIDPTYETFPQLYAISQVPISYIVIAITIPLLFVINYLVNYGNNYFLNIKSQEIALYKILGVSNYKVTKIIVLENFMMLAIALISAIIIGQPIAYLFAKILQETSGEVQVIIDSSFDIGIILFVVIMFILIYGIISIKFIIKIKKNQIIDFLNEKNKNDDPINKNKKMVIVDVTICTGLLILSYYIIITQFSRMSEIEMFIVLISIIVAISIFYQILAAGFFELIPNRWKYKNESLFTFSHMSAKIQKSIKLIFVSTFLLCFVTISIYIGLVGSMTSDLNVRTESAYMNNYLKTMQFENNDDVISLEVASKYNFSSNLDFNYLILSEDSLNKLSNKNIDITPNQMIQVNYQNKKQKNLIGTSVEIENADNSEITFNGEIVGIEETTYNYIKSASIDYGDWQLLAVDNEVFRELSQYNYVNDYVQKLKNEFKNEIEVNEVVNYTNIYWSTSNPEIKFMTDKDINELFDMRGNEEIEFDIKNHQPQLTLSNPDLKNVVITNKKTGEKISFENYTANTSIDNGNTIVINEKDATIENGFIPVNKKYLLNYGENEKIDKRVLEFDVANNRSVSTRLYTEQQGFISDTISQIFVMYMGVIMLIVSFSLLGLYSIIDARTNKSKFIALRKIGFNEKEIKRSVNYIVSSYFLIPFCSMSIFVTLNILIFNQIIEFDYNLFIKSKQFMIMIMVYSGLLFLYGLYHLLVTKIYNNIIKT